MAQIRFQEVSKRYGKDKEAVVEQFNLDIEDKEFIVFVGPSGCGKSTTLRMIAGLEDISDGEVYIDDVLVNDLPPKDRDIAMVFQNYALYPNMSVYENIAFGLRLRKLPKHEIDQAVKRAARVLEIEPFLERKPKELSGGQRQRVALGRAIVRSPKVFLMDEPLSNLDAKLRVQMRSEIIRLVKKLEVTTIYVTHDQTEAMTMGDRIVVMKGGLIQQVDTPEEIYNNPVNTFVASFVGSPPINFLEGKLQEAGERLIFRTRRFDLYIPARESSLLKEKGMLNKTITLGIRPENVGIETPLDESSSVSLIPGTVQLTELMGADRYIYLDIGVKSWLIARVNPRNQYIREEQIHVAADMSKALYFDKETGDRIID